jgi:E3 ubiquitin-protein ligase HERC2
VACGSATLYALTNQGEVFSWGQGSQGELGTGGSTKATGNPARLSWAKDIVRLEAAGGGRFAAAVDAGGKLFTWGSGERGGGSGAGGKEGGMEKGR